ncbi:response regulator transcription factor [Salisaeta longa]|uniref:response regulator transcription factor n=1 Tax=Salisaeta longa TaxID=503170 RepID=UPI0003B5FEE6|nr:response regulator transcription factor [Salisaeta longa]
MNAPSQHPHDFSASTPDERVRVFIVDDHPAIREALASTITRTLNFRLIGEAGSAQTALELLRRRPPDVVIVDLSLSDGHGFDLIETLRNEMPDVQALVFSMYDETVYAERAIRAGAAGYVMKNAPTQDVIQAIETVMQGEVYLSRRMSSRILNKVIHQKDYTLGAATERLTDREMTVFQMLGAGHNVTDIADQLDLSRKTIETYRRRAKEKLGFDTVSELLQYAVQWTYGREASSSSTETHP